MLEVLFYNSCYELWLAKKSRNEMTTEIIQDIQKREAHLSKEITYTKSSQSSFFPWTASLNFIRTWRYYFTAFCFFLTMSILPVSRPKKFSSMIAIKIVAILKKIVHLWKQPKLTSKRIFTKTEAVVVVMCHSIKYAHPCTSIIKKYMHQFQWTGLLLNMTTESPIRSQSLIQSSILISEFRYRRYSAKISTEKMEFNCDKEKNKFSIFEPSSRIYRTLTIKLAFWSFPAHIHLI